MLVGTGAQAMPAGGLPCIMCSDGRGHAETVVAWEADLRHSVTGVDEQAAHLIHHAALAALGMPQIQPSSCWAPAQRQRKQALFWDLRSEHRCNILESLQSDTL